MLIIAGIGFNSFAEDKIKKIILSGADILRFNFSYGSIEANVNNIKIAQEAIDELHSECKIMIDMPLNKVRLGDFDIKMFAVREKEEFIFKSASYSNDCNQFIPVQIQKLGEKVRVNQLITHGDGEIALHVKEIIDTDTIKCEILNNGVIQYMKTFNITNRLDENNVINDYKKIFEAVKDLSISYCAVSYFGEETNKNIRELVKKEIGSKTKIMLKIEDQIAVDNIEAICQDESYRYVLLDRGEIGVNVPFEKIGLIQRNIINTAKKYKRLILVSTQILESTINNYIPYRAEIINLTDMVLDGVNGIMLCQETTMGLRPAYSISVAKKIIDEALKYERSRSKS